MQEAAREVTCRIKVPHNGVGTQEKENVTLGRTNTRGSHSEDEALTWKECIEDATVLYSEAVLG